MEVLSYLVNDTDKWSDPRTRDWFLIRKPLHAFIILAAYILFSTKLGPIIMKNRKPLELHRIIQIYNLFQVIACTILFLEGSRVMINIKYNFICSTMDSSTDYWNLKFAELHWYYFILKLIDFSDTVFFILRKKYNQVIFLHIYHHTVAFLLSWSFTKYAIGGQAALAAWVNSFVHIIMYSYYFTASLGPKYKKYLWFKHYVTLLQIAQFILIFIHDFQSFIWDCGYPKFLTFTLAMDAAIFLYLFGKFYKKTYSVQNTASTKKDD